MTQAIGNTTFEFQDQTNFYRGKVRDVYTISDQWLVMIASDRISAFDVVLPRPIPFKGQVLNQIASQMLDATSDLVPNWKMASPDPNVTIGKKCVPFAAEMVITLPEGLKEHDKLPNPIITPTTKASEGHDEDISREQIIEQGIVSESEYLILEDYTRKLYQRGTELAAAQGLILVDTKYEFGKFENEIILMDEIHTPDSSRYFYAEGYAERQANGEKQKQLSKEFVREWLIANDFMGKEGQVVPAMTDTWLEEISNRYIELFERVTGKSFVRQEYENAESRILSSINEALVHLKSV
jgi:phosphoribosylaminoimidazole-succinocarboxamide synthase